MTITARLRVRRPRSRHADKGGRGVAAALAVVVVVGAGQAEAHDPLFLTEDDATPATGPLLPDGTISFAVYGEIRGEGDSRGLQVTFQDGDALFFELLVPDEAPENLLSEDDLPSARVVAPDGTEIIIGAPLQGTFFEPFTSTSYLRLNSVSDVAMGGTYDVWITGAAPARFTFAVGTRETFGTPVERVEERLGSFSEITDALDAWLETPPGSFGAEPPVAGGSRGDAPESQPLPSPTDGASDPSTSRESEPAAAADVAPLESIPADGGSGASVVLVIAAVLALMTPAGAAWMGRRRARRPG